MRVAIMFGVSLRKFVFTPFIYQPKFKCFFSLFSRFGVAFTYYGITLNITGFGLNPYLTQFIFASIEMPMKIGVYYFLEKVGRKHGQMGSMLLTGLCLFINIFVPKGHFSFISRTFSGLFLPPRVDMNVCVHFRW